MAQQSGTYNLVIQDPNGGQPQYIKLQKPVNIGATTKLIKADNKTVRTIMAQKPAQVVNSSGTLIHQSGFPQTMRAITIGKPTRHFVTLPVQSSLQNIVSGERSVPQVTAPRITSQTTQVRQITPAPQQIHTVPHHKPFTASILDTSARKRTQEAESEAQEMSRSMMMSVKRRKSEKGGKGLRHFSMKVCEKVRKKGLTSYNEVAEELVNEFTDPKHMPNSVDQQYDQKNIRRRVYDALNVLMAMNIISKEKKEIRWIGLPSTTAQESVSLLNEKKEIAQRIKKKTETLNELLLQQISFKSLVQRNYEKEKNKGPPTPTTSVHLPFIVVNSDKKTVIDCSISNDKTEYLFTFNDKFEIHDDFQVLRQLGLTYGIEDGTVTDADLEIAKTLVTKPFEKFVAKMAYANRSAAQASGGGEDDTRGSASGERPGASSPGPSQTDGDSAVEVSTDDESNMTDDDEEDNN